MAVVFHERVALSILDLRQLAFGILPVQSVAALPVSDSVVLDLPFMGAPNRYPVLFRVWSILGVHLSLPLCGESTYSPIFYTVS